MMSDRDIDKSKRHNRHRDDQRDTLQSREVERDYGSREDRFGRLYHDPRHGNFFALQDDMPYRHGGYGQSHYAAASEPQDGRVRAFHTDSDAERAHGWGAPRESSAQAHSAYGQRSDTEGSGFRRQTQGVHNENYGGYDSARRYHHDYEPELYARIREEHGQAGHYRPSDHGGDPFRDNPNLRPPYWYEARERPGHFRGVGPKGYRRSAARILEDVCERLTEDRHIDASDVQVTVDGSGIVHLRGTVEDRHVRHQIEDLVSGIRGVVDVENMLAVARHATHRRETSSATRAGEDTTGERGRKRNETDE